MLIIESGATKADWCLVRRDGSVDRYVTDGMNLSAMSEDVVSGVMEGVLSEIDPSLVDEIHFYAAGLLLRDGERVPVNAEVLDDKFRNSFPSAEIEYASDLLGAARAVCGRKAGIAAILGTGSNSCFYDGLMITKNVRSAGFILGDEGGGACLGKMFVSDFLKGLVPEPIASEFAAEFNADYLTVVGNVYRGDAPSRYLGSFAPWILARYDSSDYVRELVDSNFRSFIERALLQYDVKNCPVGIVGGFGYVNREIFGRIAATYGLRIGSVLAAPLDGLIKYHSSK